MIQFYNDVHPKLSDFINHYWFVDDLPSDAGGGVLLPMDHVDLIITEDCIFEYVKGDDVIKPKSVHFHGIRQSTVNVLASKNIRALGVSFNPWGFYQLLNIDMNKFVDKIEDLEIYDLDLSINLKESFNSVRDLAEIINKIENILIPYYEIHNIQIEKFDIVNEFIESDCENILDYCDSRNLSSKKLLRYFNKIIGISPKTFMAIRRFENSSRAVIYDDATMTDITYESKYYDQSHFVRNFKRFTSYSPGVFKIIRPSLKSKLFDKRKN